MKASIKYFKRTVFFLVVLFVGCTVIGCTEDEEEMNVNQVTVEANGLTKSINDLVPEYIIEEMKSLGMPIYTGDSPPKDLENIYLASPFILKGSNISTDVLGFKFIDYYLKLENQNNNLLTIKVDYKNGNENGKGIGSFIVGKFSSFSIFSEIKVVKDGKTAKAVYIYSGTIAEDGIENLHVALFMIDNNGYSPPLINNGGGRVIYDSSGLSETVNSFKTNKIKDELKSVMFN
ncbi:MAG: hypothetical protein DRJ07_20025 [Bacteroidetes bacterium]|nr:MAG: hypothetical protein DRJ07_20025 [Bacteroidota bacterium]